MRINGKKNFVRRHFTLAIMWPVLSAFIFCGCVTTGRDGFEIFGPSDETSEAAKIVVEANRELTRIKVLYRDNEGKRLELKTALEANNAAEVKRISEDVVQIINEGMNLGTSAIDKVEQAREMRINDDYKEYLRLKSEALKKQLEAFENYRQAARSLRDNYDPKNSQLREKVKVEFDQRSENYRTIMEKARDLSSQANELYKDSLRRQREK